VSETIIAVDCGTTRIKCGVLTDQGDFRLVYAAPTPMLRAEPGAASQDPGRIVQRCLEGLRRCAAHAERPLALALTGQMGGIIVTDGAGAPLTPWFTTMDARCRAAAQRLRAEVGARVRRLAASSPEQAERLRWLRESGALADGPALALLLAPFVAVQLSREGPAAAYCDRTCLGWSGLADVAAMQWDDELVRAACWSRDRLPRIVEPGTTVGHLAGAIAAATGLPDGLPLIAGPGDQAASLYGLGCTTPGDGVDSAATFPLLAGVIDRFLVPRSPRIEVMPGAERNSWYPMGFMAGSGAAPGWFAADIAGVAIDVLEREAREVGDAAGVVALPYGALGGSVAGRGAFRGLDLHHRRGHLYRAILEGLACEYGMLHEELAAEGVMLKPPIVAYGGGTASPLLTQLKASVLGLPIRCLVAEELTVAGVALLAARRQGWDIELWLSPGTMVVPSASDIHTGRSLLERYRRMRNEAIHAIEPGGGRPDLM
jgi:xylulokinase